MVEPSVAVDVDPPSSGPDMGHLEAVASGAICELKAEMFGVVASVIRDTYAAKEVDVSSEELMNITKLCLELSAVEEAATSKEGS